MKENGMKKFLNIAMAYAVAALCCGVFYREFTRMNDFQGECMLNGVHTHLFVLGMIIFLIVASFAARFNLEGKKVKQFLIVYNTGVILTAILMIVRGIMQVKGVALAKGADKAISGVAGLAHIITAAGIVRMINVLKKADKDNQ